MRYWVSGALALGISGALGLYWLEMAPVFEISLYS